MADVTGSHALDRIRLASGLRFKFGLVGFRDHESLGLAIRV